MLDSPTNNFCTLDPNFRAVTANTLSEGNLKCVTSTSGRSFNAGSFLMTPNSGKWYYEVRVSGNGAGMGVARVNGSGGAYQSVTSTSTSTGTTDYYYGENNWGVYNHNIVHNGSSVVSLSGSASYPEVYGIAVDMDASPPNLAVYVGGSAVGNVDLDTGFDYIPIAGDGSGGTTRTLDINFGQNPTFNGEETAGTNTDGNGKGLFHDAVPSGHLALCASNLPDTTISPNQDTQADDHFIPYSYTADNTDNKARTGLGFQPDWLWFKDRDTAFSHGLYDSSRGADKYLSSNTTGAEATYDLMSSFDADGFTTQNDASSGNIWNYSSDRYIVWSWKAG